MNLHTKKTYVSRDVYFVEDWFPFAKINSPSKSVITPVFQLQHDNFKISSGSTVPLVEPSSSTITSVSVSAPPVRPSRNKTLTSKCMDYSGMYSLLTSSTSSANHVTYHIQQYLSYHVFKLK